MAVGSRPAFAEVNAAGHRRVGPASSINSVCIGRRPASAARSCGTSSAALACAGLAPRCRGCVPGMALTVAPTGCDNIASAAACMRPGCRHNCCTDIAMPGRGLAAARRSGNFKANTAPVPPCRGCIGQMVVRGSCPVARTIGCGNVNAAFGCWPAVCAGSSAGIPAAAAAATAACRTLPPGVDKDKLLNGFQVRRSLGLSSGNRCTCCKPKTLRVPSAWLYLAVTLMSKAGSRSPTLH